MAKNAYVHARVDKHIKESAEKVLSQVGISTSDLINILLHQVVLTRGVPFDVKVPNQETIEALAELERGEGEQFTGSAAELRKHILAPSSKARAAARRRRA